MERNRNKIIKKMKYLSIDIETTAIKPENGQILSIGIIIEDTNNLLSFEDIPKLHRIFNHKKIYGEPFALNMNAGLIETIKEGKSEELMEPRKLAQRFNNFLYENGMKHYDNVYWQNSLTKEQKLEITPLLPYSVDKKIRLNAAGKNFGTFDKIWLENEEYFNQYFEFHQRVLDPGNLFVNFKNDEWIPNLSLCKERSDLKDTGVTHNALEDAWDVIQVLRTKY